MRKFLKSHWLSLVLWLFLILPLGGFLLTSAAFFAYIYWPADVSRIDFTQFATDKRYMTVLVHGVKDDTTSWVNDLQVLYENSGDAGHVVGLDWSDYARSSLRCAVLGRRLGRRVGMAIAANGALEGVHLVGHSCGAFVVFGACQTIKRRGRSINVHTTYLDPVSVHGLNWDYGIDNFGRCADYSDAFIDTDDDIPGSNQLLPHTHTYDVTQVRKRRGEATPPHLWPIRYYRELVAEGDAPALRGDTQLQSRKPRGVLEVVEESTGF